MLRKLHLAPNRTVTLGPGLLDSVPRVSARLGVGSVLAMRR